MKDNLLEDEAAGIKAKLVCPQQMAVDQLVRRSKREADGTTVVSFKLISPGGLCSYSDRFEMDSCITSEYLSVPDIMALGQKVTCKFVVNCYGLGFIDPSGDSTDVAEGTKLELPLWMAKVLQGRHIIEIEVPKSYSETFKEQVEADAMTLDFHRHGPNYYTFGKHLVSMRVKGAHSIAQSMIDAFRQRFHKIFDYAVNTSSDTQQQFLDFQATLDNQELSLLKLGRSATSEFKHWERRTHGRLTASEIVTSLNKRKAAMIEDE